MTWQTCRFVRGLFCVEVRMTRSKKNVQPINSGRDVDSHTCGVFAGVYDRAE